MSPSPANARVAEWVVSEFVEQDNDMNSFVSNSCEVDSNLFQMCPLEKPERKLSSLSNSVSAPLYDTNGRKARHIPRQKQKLERSSAYFNGFIVWSRPLFMIECVLRVLNRESAPQAMISPVTYPSCSAITLIWFTKATDMKSIWHS